METLTTELIKDLEFAIAVTGRTYPVRAEEISKRLDAFRTIDVVVDDLTTLVQRLIRQIENDNPGTELAVQAAYYLNCKGLVRCPLRSARSKDAKVAAAYLKGLARHVRKCPDYEKLVVDMDHVDTAISILSTQESAITEPCVLYRPTLIIKEGRWCAFYGVSQKEGVVGFGDSPAEAMQTFNEAWHAKCSMHEG